ncbi:hypothetical protein LOTGIDRAFT_157159 [Lottia gigantea]|uniref:Uncharacterized protein n=1 Tax=Lottia gigantea TaxID=225164 RepID=V4AWX5_LOTGI|nr:hypothetical protein LOTGIDRAFT_157159 [Lottia gigantea]ESP02028.1 hypothetical protein LOTGIDRAFT_157159 [Lottia gigantea]
MNVNRNKLVWDAIPSIFPDLPNPPPQLTSQRKPPAMRNISILNLPQIEEEKCQVHVQKIVQLHTELISARQKPEYNLSAGEIVQAAVDIGMKPATAKWTVNEKAMALGIYFRSRKANQTLCALFTMPSASTLNSFNFVTVADVMGMGVIFTYSFMEGCGKIDKSLPVRMAPKLTTKHIFLPPFSPMRVITSLFLSPRLFVDDFTNLDL